MTQKPNFQQILLSLIEKYQSMPGANINEVIAAATKEYGLSEEAQKTIEETNQMLDAFHEKAEELRAAKDEQHISTQRWLGQQIDAILEKASGEEEEKAQVANALIETINEKLNTEITQN